MAQHYSPQTIAKVFSTHMPKRVTSILEPAVGQGDLLKPLIAIFGNTFSRIVCIDIDSTVIRKARNELEQFLHDKTKLQMINSDFIAWSSTMISNNRYNYFDCIIMNPPFAGNSAFLKLDLTKESKSIIRGNRSLPIEAAFVWRAIHLLNPQGRLLAVVPSSVIAAIKTTWLREYMMKIGSVDYVHELPKFTFPKVESRVYLLVFTRDKLQRGVALNNHDLLDTASIQINKEEILQHIRFDYSFQLARRSIERAMKLNANLKWTRLRDTANVYRGSVKSVLGIYSAIHTNFYKNGFWRLLKEEHLKQNVNSKRSIKKGDLLIKRVSRKCSQTLGIGDDLEHYPCSDCILIIRANNKRMNATLLFSMRTLFATESGRNLLERGSGATYITEAELLDLFVPLDLFRIYPSPYKKYKRAINRRDIQSMRFIEQTVAKKISL